MAVKGVPVMLRWSATLVQVVFWSSFITGLFPLAYVAELLIGDDRFWGVLLGIVWLPFYVVWPLFCVLVAALPIALVWRNPQRIALLRPFGYASRKGPLRQLARNVLATLGHTYTLSDQTIKEPWYSRSVILGALGLLALPHRYIRTAADWGSLQRLLERRFARNLNWLVSRHHVFTLRSSDELWRPTVGALVSAAKLIVIDVTGLKAGVTEEIEYCRQVNRLDDVILLVDAAEEPAARARFAEDAELRERPLFIWPEREPGKLLECLGARRTQTSARQFASVLLACVCGCAIALFALVQTQKLIAEWLVPVQFPGLSLLAPWAAPVALVYTRAANKSDEELAARARVRLARKFPQRLRALSLDVLSKPEAARERVVVAIRDLALVGSKDDLALLTKRFKDALRSSTFSRERKDEPSLYEPLVDAIRALGGDPAAAVLAALESVDESWISAMDLIRTRRFQCDTPACQDLLIRGLSMSRERPTKDSVETFSLAVDTLVLVRGCTAMPALFAILSDKPGFNDYAHLEKVVTVECVPELLAFIDDPRQPVQALLTQAFHSLKDPRIVNALWSRLDVNKKSPLLDAALSGDDLPRLFELLKDKTRRRWAFEHIGALRDRRALDQLFDLLTKADCATFRCDAGSTIHDILIWMNDELPYVIGKLGDRRKAVRKFARERLGRDGDCTAVVPLLEIEPSLWDDDTREAIDYILDRHPECVTQLEQGKPRRVDDYVKWQCEHTDSERAAHLAHDPSAIRRRIAMCVLAREAAEQ